MQALKDLKTVIVLGPILVSLDLIANYWKVWNKMEKRKQIENNFENVDGGGTCDGWVE